MSSPRTQSSPMNVVLERVVLRYGRADPILNDINLSLDKGSFTFLTGPSGAGKTSLLKLINLDMLPQRGLISMMGQSIDNLNRKDKHALKRRIGFISQGYDLIAHLNVFENAALPLRVAGHARTTYKDNVTDLLRWVGLGSRLEHMPETLSSGEVQRLAIARAVVTQPAILLADEPTGNVDPDMSERLLKLFLEMNRGGTTILIATHDKELVNSIHADTYRLDAGKLHTMWKG